MMYRAKVTHIWRIIQTLNKEAHFHHDANDVWYECKTEAIAANLERANEAVAKAQQQANHKLKNKVS